MLSFAFALTQLLSLYFLSIIGAVMQPTLITNGILDSTPHTLFHPIAAKLTIHFSSIETAPVPQVDTLSDVSNLKHYECVS